MVLIYYCLGQTLPGGSLSHKESIFLKLNKRIGNLELNLSLSNEYLSELSRRYVEQTNDSRKQVEKAMKLAQEIAYRTAQSSQHNLKLKVLFNLQEKNHNF